MKTQVSELKPQRISYDEIVQEEGYVTGIAHFENQDGPGGFRFRVSGQEAAVLMYAEEAVVQKLALHVLDEEQLWEQLAERRASALELRRAYWHDWLEQRCEALHGLVDVADLALLADNREWSVRLCLELLTFRKPLYLEEPAFDPTQDRLIRVEPLDIGADVKYRLEWLIHPTVKAGKCDIYQPVDAGISEAWARVSSTVGDADLYLYRGGVLKDSSTSSGVLDEVSASGGKGLWRLYVYGYTDAQYTQPADWIKI